MPSSYLYNVKSFICIYYTIEHKLVKCFAKGLLIRIRNNKYPASLAAVLKYLRMQAGDRLFISEATL